MSYLIVVAHPDDEVLGAGATIYKLSKMGTEVNVCIMCGQADARQHRPADYELESDMKSSMNMLGIKNIFVGNFPNIKMNTSAHLDLVQFIEKAIEKTQATTIITHHPTDLNNDHLQTSIACQAAARLFERKETVIPIKELLYMEVLSSTEWALNSALMKFCPNTFFEVGKDGIEKKLLALSQYRDVIREYPHPRSKEAIVGLAAYRGAQSGYNYAEAFECAFRRMVE
ncbi:MAG: PIG-L family deacetylase [Lachnospiraceae bacterium]|nr:PIG-L family deacetylase [Clostridiales bacterium]MCC8141171.1 PIG-L family deacetylase [Lachnospiraceae bacterium]